MRRWFKTYCPGCGYKIEYEPQPGFRGEFRCPHCAHEFKIPTLLDFITPKIINVLQGGRVVPVESKHFWGALQSA